MVLCQYFLAGNCRFGTKCFNDHIDLKQIIRVEIDSTIKGNQWPISCFGPFKDKPCIPNFIEDQSFEEVRYKFYEAKANGNFEQVRQGFINLIQESKSKLQQLNMLSPEIMNIFVQLYDAGSEPKKVNPVGQTVPIAANPFAATNIGNSQVANQAQSIFGKSTFTTTPDQSAASIFGGTPPNQQQTSNIFASGSFAATNQSPGIFGGGQTAQQPSQSIFGASTQPFDPGNFLVDPFKGANAGSQFALPQIGTQQQTQSVFGPTQPAQGVFGVPTQPQPGTNSIFGGQTTFQQPNQPIQSVFAAPANQSPFVGGQHGIFSQQQQPTAANIFQNQQQQPQQTSIFAQAPQPDSNVAQMSTNVFNQLPQQPTSVFAQHQNTAQSPFQQPLPHLQQQQQQKQPPIQASPFAPAQQQQVQVQQAQVQQVQVQPVQNPPPPPTNGYYDSCYSKLADLTPEELEAFKSDQFEVGQIPTVPPPKELCF